MTGTDGLPQQEDQLSPQLSADLSPPPADAPSGQDKQEWPIPTGTGEPEIPIPSLRLLSLQLSQPEVNFMTRLAPLPLLPTPRAAKKLVNLYRLVRIGIPDADLAAFTGSDAGGQYQVVQILLAVLVGIPAAAKRIFDEIMSASHGTDIIGVFAKAATLGSPEMVIFSRISEELSTISADTPLMTEISEYQRWCPKLAQHSFYTQPLW